MIIDILGTEYKILESDRLKDEILESADGYCDCSTKTIIIDTFKINSNSQKDLKTYRDKVIRHEIIHAFLHESGLDSSSWGVNEEIVDWFALQLPKISAAIEIIKRKEGDKVV